ncbi:hypothetical protein L7F22_045636 [Adiantum nelumboides]|nr:hypothetical protein [Adiantum nelumboides]
MIFVKDSLSDDNKMQINESGIHENLELSKILSQFQDVFIDDISGELPPNQGDVDRAIELLLGSSLPNKPPYRVSQAQQKEIMRQVNELVEKEMGQWRLGHGIHGKDDSHLDHDLLKCGCRRQSTDCACGIANVFSQYWSLEENKRGILVAIVVCACYGKDGDRLEKSLRRRTSCLPTLSQSFTLAMAFLECALPSSPFLSGSSSSSSSAFLGISLPPSSNVSSGAQHHQRGKCHHQPLCLASVSPTSVVSELAHQLVQGTEMPRVDPRSVVSIILGGGAGTRLFPLTKRRAKPAVPIGGAYRLIDVPMSNCINSGINKVFILTQFNSQSLNRHLARTYNFGNGVNFGDGFVESTARKRENHLRPVARMPCSKENDTLLAPKPGAPCGISLLIKEGKVTKDNPEDYDLYPAA